MAAIRILFATASFPPAVGGLPTVSAILAREFGRLGYDVAVITGTAATDDGSAPYALHREPSARVVRGLARWADVVFHNNILTRMTWPQFLMRKPWVVAHHMWIPRSGSGALAGHLKHFATRFATNISVSHAVAASLCVPSIVIGNPYDDALFATDPTAARTRDIAFVGRLIADKGVDVLLRALALVRPRGAPVGLSIFGAGAEEPRLRRLSRDLGLEAQVTYCGERVGADLVRQLNMHRLLVVPSVWEEPFGVVALEGLACGLVPIVAQSGGLPDAVGPCGVVVPKGDPAALAVAIQRFVDDPAAAAPYLQERHAHLQQHTAESVARKYLSVIEAARNGRGPRLAG